MSQKERQTQTIVMINDNCSSVATHFRCGGIVNNHIKKGVLLSLLVKKIKICA